MELGLFSPERRKLRDLKIGGSTVRVGIFSQEQVTRQIDTVLSYAKGGLCWTLGRIFSQNV